MVTSITIPKPFDMHVHFRDGELLPKIAKWISRYFDQALAMPNLRPPICTASQIKDYCQNIQAAMGSPDVCKPLMTFKIMPGMDPGILSELKAWGALAGKAYPLGLTTHAEDGIEDFLGLYPILAQMEKLDLMFLVHGEKPGKGLKGIEREQAFLPTLRLIAKTFPKLRIVMEHITTAAAVETILQLPDNVAATITVHHLLLTHDDVGGDRMRPHHFCKPIAKWETDRQALLDAAVSGCKKFIFGSDTAAHPKDQKECDECCAGVYSAPVTLPLLAKIFERRNALDRLRIFTHDAAAEFYELQLPHPKPTITLEKKVWVVPQEIEGLVPFWAGQEITWNIKE